MPLGRIHLESLWTLTGYVWHLAKKPPSWVLQYPYYPSVSYSCLTQSANCGTLTRLEKTKPYQYTYLMIKFVCRWLTINLETWNVLCHSLGARLVEVAHWPNQNEALWHKRVTLSQCRPEKKERFSSYLYSYAYVVLMVRGFWIWFHSFMWSLEVRTKIFCRSSPGWCQLNQPITIWTDNIFLEIELRSHLTQNIP